MAVEPQNKFLQDYFHIYGDQLTYKGNFRSELIGIGETVLEVVQRILVHSYVQGCRGCMVSLFSLFGMCDTIAMVCSVCSYDTCTTFRGCRTQYFTHVVYFDQLQTVSSSVYFYRLLGASLNTLISIHDSYIVLYFCSDQRPGYNCPL